MYESIAMMAIGAIIALLGIINMMGNLSTLHSYHYKRVSEENRKIFGRLVGGGTVVVGASIIVNGILSLIANKTGADALIIVGTVVLLSGVVVGLFLSFYAMIKYNKGIF